MSAVAGSGAPECSSCGAALEQRLVDLGESPLANALLSEEMLADEEPRYPLTAWVCGHCFLVQVPPVARRERIFSDDYPYFSSISSTWRAHCERYAREMVDRLGLGAASRVIELASNDGCLLQRFRERGIEVLGIEPAASVAAAARERGVPTREEFFGERLAGELARAGQRPDLLLANNVLAHVPDLNDFVGGMRRLLAPEGVLTVEFPHLLCLLRDTLFDTIYHEHYSYFSLATAARLFERHGLEIFDVEELPTHGGSLRLFAAHRERGRAASGAVAALLAREREHGLDRLEGYASFEQRAQAARRRLREFLEEVSAGGGAVAGYGAPAKATTLLNYCGVGPDLLAFTVDRNEHKQGRYIPGVRVPILEPEALVDAHPDYVLILPWNLRREIEAQLPEVPAWGGRFVVALPELEVSG